MAKRLILSMLALLTGLFAQIGPAQANPCAAGTSAVGAVLGVRAEAPTQSEYVAAQPVCRPEIAPPARLVATGTVHAPATRIGIDRSLQ